ARAIEAIAGVPARMIPGSEFEANERTLGHRRLVVAVSQSGETADTHTAIVAARGAGARTIGVLNKRDSTIAKSVEGFVDIHAGPEIGVASTKVYTSMLLSLLLLAVKLAEARGEGGAARSWLRDGLEALPDAVRRAIARRDEVREAAREVHRAQSMLYL